MELNELHEKILEGLSGKERLDLVAGLKALNMANPADRIALREAVKRLHPEYTDAQIDVFMRGR